jgi:hypothetical protein
MMMKRLCTSIGLSALVASCLSGCGPGGNLADENYPGQTLGVVQGALGGDIALGITEPVSMAIVWAASFPTSVLVNDVAPTGSHGDLCAMAPTQLSSIVHVNPGFRISQQVTYEPIFPIQFSIPITTLPPVDAQLDLSSLGGTGKFSFGFVVAYVDANKNGRFDQGSPANAPERLLASSFGKDLNYIMFLDGTPPPQFLAPSVTVPQGLSMYSVKDFATSAPAGPSVVPVNTPVTLGTPPPTFGVLMGCESFESRKIFGGNRLAGSSAIVGTCGTGPEGSIYLWRSEVVPTACVFEERQGAVCLASGAPEPADWPCP